MTLMNDQTKSPGLNRKDDNVVRKTNSRNVLLFGIAGIVILLLLSFANSSCNVYKFRDIAIPDSIKTIKVNFIENRAPYVNPLLSPRLTDRLKQKIVTQTKLAQTNNDNAD